MLFRSQRLFFFFSMLLINILSVYSGAKMAEGGEIYVDLRDEFGSLDPNAPVLAMLHRLQQELAELRSQNDILSSASKEQEKLIRELTSRNSQEGEGSRKRKMDESDEDDVARHQYKQKRELLGEF